VNGVGSFVGGGRNPLAIRTVSQTENRFRMRAQDGKLPARNGVAQVDKLPGTHCHPLAIGANTEALRSSKGWYAICMPNL
jgi:hypothetical protein